MCGIVGFTGKTQAAGFLLEGLERLEYRGYDSAGIAVLNDNNLTVCKTTERIKNLAEKTKGGKDIHGTTGIGHTRWATTARRRIKTLTRIQAAMVSSPWCITELLRIMLPCAKN